MDKALMTKAGALLLDAAGMLQIEAQEWRDRSRETPPPAYRSGGAKAWAERCERIASTNISAATSMSETAKKIAAALEPIGAAPKPKTED